MPKQSKNKKDTSSKQTENQDKKEDMPVSDKVAGNDDDSTTNRLITNFIIHMHDSDLTVPMFYDAHFCTDLETGDVDEMHDDTIIDTIYRKVVFEAIRKMLDKYDLSERRKLSKLFKRGRESNDLHRAFYFENADRRVIIDQKKKTDFGIIRGIYNTSHAVKNDDIIVFDFDELLVNMAAMMRNCMTKLLTFGMNTAVNEMIPKIPRLYSLTISKIDPIEKSPIKMIPIKMIPTVMLPIKELLRTTGKL